MKTTTVTCDACGRTCDKFVMNKATLTLEYEHTTARDQYELRIDLCEPCTTDLTTEVKVALLPKVKKEAWKWSAS